MRDPRPYRITRLAWVGVGLTGILLTVAVGQSRTAMERGNRLYRAGAARAAADVFAVRIDTTALGFRASYNLGTALIQLESEQSERYLISAIEGSDSAAVQRAHYNLGYRLLTGVEADSDSFSAVPLLSGAINHNRAALRLDPGDENAKWNLALALRIYGELAQVFEEGPADDAGGAAKAPEDESARAVSETAEGEAGEEPEDLPLSENAGTQEVILVGVQEALAKGDPGPLTEEMSMRLLEQLTDDTELLVRGILWSQRPDIEWWEDEPFPGGGW